VITGYRLARGHAAIQLDCDLQDPPELFLDFLGLWEKGHDVVVGVRRFSDEGRYLQWARQFYYRLLKSISSDNLMLDSGDFRLVDRSILDQLRRIDDVSPYTRGLTSLLAANQIGVPYARTARKQGASKFPLLKLIGLAVDGFIAHSTVPLRIATAVGLLGRPAEAHTRFLNHPPSVGPDLDRTPRRVGEIEATRPCTIRPGPSNCACASSRLTAAISAGVLGTFRVAS
jgi:hypothetical protein